MRITVELSLYPLDANYIPRIESFIHSIGRPEGVDVSVNQLSTQLNGEFEAVTAAVNRALAESFKAGEPQALIVKYLNADLPIGEAPDLGVPR